MAAPSYLSTFDADGLPTNPTDLQTALTTLQSNGVSKDDLQTVYNAYAAKYGIGDTPIQPAGTQPNASQAISDALTGVGIPGAIQKGIQTGEVQPSDYAKQVIQAAPPAQQAADTAAYQAGKTQQDQQQAKIDNANAILGQKINPETGKPFTIDDIPPDQQQQTIENLNSGGSMAAGQIAGVLQNTGIAGFGKGFGDVAAQTPIAQAGRALGAPVPTNANQGGLGTNSPIAETIGSAAGQVAETGAETAAALGAGGLAGAGVRAALPAVAEAADVPLTGASLAQKAATLGAKGLIGAGEGAGFTAGQAAATGQLPSPEQAAANIGLGALGSAALGTNTGLRAAGSGLIGAGVGGAAGAGYEALKGGNASDIGKGALVGAGIGAIGGVGLSLSKSAAIAAFDKFAPLLSGISAGEKAAIQSIASTPDGKEAIGRYLAQAQAKLADDSAPPTVSLALDRIAEARQSINTQLQSAGKTFEDAKTAAESVTIPQKEASSIVNSSQSEIGKRFGFTVGDEGISNIAGRSQNISSEDANTVQQMHQVVEDFASIKNPTAAQAIDTEQRLRDMVPNPVLAGAKQASKIDAYATAIGTKLSGLADKYAGENFVNASSKYSQLKGLQGDLQKAANFGENDPRGVTFLKRMFSERGTADQQLADRIKSATGVDLSRDAYLSKFITEKMGAPSDKSDLQRIITGAVFSPKATAIGGIVNAATSKLAPDTAQVIQKIAGMPTEQKLGYVSDQLKNLVYNLRSSGDDDLKGLGDKIGEMLGKLPASVKGNQGSIPVKSAIGHAAAIGAAATGAAIAAKENDKPGMIGVVKRGSIDVNRPRK